MKRVMRIILLLAAMITMLSICTYAEDMVEYTAPDGVRYRVDFGSGVTAYCIDKNITQAEIPESINGYQVTRIDFSNCSRLASAVIPEGVASFIFSGCSALSRVTIPDSITDIGSKAFYNCSSLKSVELPKALNMIRDDAFNGCSALASIDIPEGVSLIGGNAFSGCSSLTSVSIPETVNYIGVEAFSDCSSLASINIPDGIKTIEAGTFSNCSSLKSIVIPESTTDIRENAFENCTALKNVEFSDAVTSIGSDAFNNCKSLKTVKLPESLTYIGWAAFRNCSSLKSAVIPGSVTVIKAGAFSGCSKLRITIPASVVSIGGYDYKTADFAPFYRVRAAKYEGNSAGAIKSAISPYSSKITAHTITLKWTEFTKASAYRIYKYNHKAGKWKLLKTIKNTKTTSYKVKKLKSNKKYSFKVKVIVDGKSYENKLRGQYTYRVKPSKINSVRLYTGAGYVKSVWSSSRGAAGYQIQIASDSKFSKNLKTKTYYRSNIHSRTFKNLKHGSKYYVRVRAFNDRSRSSEDNTWQYSAWSKTVSIRCR